MVKAVVFDLDDTLISESHYQKSAQDAVFLHLQNLAGISLEKIKSESEIAEKAPRDQYFQRLLPRLGLTASSQMVSDLINVHRGHLPSISWYPDVLPTLEQLRLRGFKLGVITDGYAVAQHQKLQAVKAAEYFDAIVVSDDLGREYWKPHQKTFLTMASQLGVEAQEMMYVGDNPEKDFFISSSLPITTVRITRTDSLKGDRGYYEGVVEDYVVKSLLEIVELLNHLNESEKNEAN